MMLRLAAIEAFACLLCLLHVTTPPPTGTSTPAHLHRHKLHVAREPWVDLRGPAAG